MLTVWLKQNLSSKKVQYCCEKIPQTIYLKEKDKSVNMTVELVNVGNTVTTIRLDKIGHHSSVRSEGYLRNVCDYLLVTHADGRLHAIFVELKKTLNGETKPREQLRRSLPLFHYFLSTFRVDTGTRLSESKVKVSYYLIGQQWNKYVDKQSTRFDPRNMFQTEQYDSITIRKCVAQAIPFEEFLKS